VSALPKLRQDLVLVEQTYHGEQSYILKDPETRKYFRFRPVEVVVMQVLDGESTAEQAAAALAAEGVRVGAKGVDSFARKLQSMGLCERTMRERSVLAMERLRAERRLRLKKGSIQGDMLRLRWSVGDPDKLFDRWLPRLRFFFTRTFLAISVALFAVYFILVGIKWPEFSRAITDLYTFNFTLGTFAILWLTSIVIVIIHELGHGFTCKYFGGQVHEIGAMLIYFEPAFYCNVNDAWTFPDLHARLWVTAAGSWIQLVIAGIAAVVWWAVTPGSLISEFALAAVLLGGITTVFVNMNPLIPLDGYYALSDFLEVPNLRQRALGYLAWFLKTKVFRLELPKPPADVREERIFLIYGALAAVYITMILTLFAATMAGWLSRWLGVLGVVIFAVGMWLVLRKQVREWWQTARLAFRNQAERWRGKPVQNWVAGLGLGVLVLGVIFPWPVTISGPLVVWPALRAPLTTPDSGMVASVQVREGTRVSAGAPLVHVRNLELERELVVHRRVADSLAFRASQARARGQAAELALIETALSSEKAQIDGLAERVAALQLRAGTGGVVVTPRPEELAGRWVWSGEEVLQVGRPDSVEIRIGLVGAGGTLVRSGQPVRLLSRATMESPQVERLSSVSTVAGPHDALEARVRMQRSPSFQPGMTGEARITVRQSNVWGALWWNLRRRIRSDILL
jgi:putative peptide zinc metalloprotease protein